METAYAGLPHFGLDRASFLYRGVVVPREGGGGTADNAATVEGLSRALAWLVLVLACAVLAGWLLDVRTLTSVVPDYNTMKVNTALCLLALSGAVLVRSAHARTALSVGVALLTSATVVQIWSGTSLGIDEFLLEDRVTTGTAPPGRMALATAVGLAALSVALLLVRGRHPRWAQAILIVPTVIGVTALLGYLFDVEQFYRVASISSVALHTAVALLAVALALAAVVPGGLVPWVGTGRGPGALVVRQSVPIIVGGLTVFGLIRKSLGDHGVFGEHFGIALMVMFGIGISIGALVFSARRLDVADAARAEAEGSLRSLVASLAAGRDEAWARAENLASELVQERLRFDRAVSSTEAVVWSVETTEGSLDQVYTSTNVERVLGDRLLPEESVVAALVRLAADDQQPAVLELRRCVLGGAPVESEVRLLDGSAEKWIRVQGVPRQEGARTYFDGIITDVTEQHAIAVQREGLLAQEQVQVERLSQLDHLRNEFIAVAGHELRTPVAVILGFCEMLVDPDTTDAARAEGAAIIARRAHQLNELVDRVFDLAKIDSGAMDLNPERVRTATFVEDLIEEHQRSADQVGIGLSADVGEAVVLADAQRLRQIFDNLLSNAVKYTPRGGHVSLRVAVDGDAVVFEVADDGIGVEPDELPRLFERLFRASSAREARIAGTGLGLAVTKALVEAHCGTITVRQNDPRGLVFRVTLPQADVHEPGVVP